MFRQLEYMPINSVDLCNVPSSFTFALNFETDEKLLHYLSPLGVSKLTTHRDIRISTSIDSTNLDNKLSMQIELDPDSSLMVGVISNASTDGWFTECILYHTAHTESPGILIDTKYGNFEVTHRFNCKKNDNTLSWRCLSPKECLYVIKNFLDSVALDRDEFERTFKTEGAVTTYVVKYVDRSDYISGDPSKVVYGNICCFDIFQANDGTYCVLFTPYRNGAQNLIN